MPRNLVGVLITGLIVTAVSLAILSRIPGVMAFIMPRA